MVFTDVKKTISMMLVSGLAVFLFMSHSQAFDASRLKKKDPVVQKTSNTDQDDTKTDKTASSGEIEFTAQIKSGKELYGNTCLFCHGAKGIGARAPNLIAGHWAPGGANDDKYMMSVIKEGRANTIMGAFKDSHTDEQIKAIMAYLRYEAKLLKEKSKK